MLLFEKVFSFTFAGLEDSMIPKVMIRPSTQVRHGLKIEFSPLRRGIIENHILL
jgi:hypothetical protein